MALLETKVMKKSTKDVPLNSPFEAHGRIDYRIEGRILRAAAVGPFNSELVTVIPAAISALVAKLASEGKWGQIITFHESALASLDALSDFEQYLKSHYSNVRINPVTALVLGTDIEGASVMAPLFEKCYVEAGIECRCFDNLSAALYWVESKIFHR
jgi:hypothetical protein